MKGSRHRCLDYKAYQNNFDAIFRKAEPPLPDHEEPPTPCCGYTCTTVIPYAVMWNPYNGVVQCHNCGETYAPVSRPPDIRGYWTKDGKFHEGMPPVGEPNPEWMTL